MSKRYITTTLPYVNADPHIGFALEIIQADTLARWYRLQGDEVVFNTGTDEHGQKIYRNAQEAGMDPKAYCDRYAAKFHELRDALNLSYTNFIRTTDEHHVRAAQEFWKRCAAAGDIYKTRYQVKYCVGCELEKTDSELVDGVCPIHPKLAIELRDEENYFFRWSKYAEALLAHYEAHPDFVVPASRQKEIATFVRGGLQDFSISRLKSKMPWGIGVPGDDDHVMYVWFDALVNYISTLGWPEDQENFAACWPGIQVAGKDNLRQQSAMWQGMLLSAGLPLSKQIFIHGFITADGQKMSKSLGNVVNPNALIAKYGTDATRYYLLGALPAYEDGDFSVRHFEENHNSKLANGLGNLLNRVLSMTEKYFDGKVPDARRVTGGADSAWDAPRKDMENAWSEYEKSLAEFNFGRALEAVWAIIRDANLSIDTNKPWVLAKENKDRLAVVMYHWLEQLRHIGWMLKPALPETAEKLLKQLGVAETEATKTLEQAKVWGGLPVGATIAKGEPLFPRLEENKAA